MKRRLVSILLAIAVTVAFTPLLASADTLTIKFMSGGEETDQFVSTYGFIEADGDQYVEAVGARGEVSYNWYKCDAEGNKLSGVLFTGSDFDGYMFSYKQPGKEYVLCEATDEETTCARVITLVKRINLEAKGTVSDVVYNGKSGRCPVIKYNGKTLKKGTDYSITFQKSAKDRKNVGKYRYDITGKGYYRWYEEEGDEPTYSYKYFRILPKATSIKSLSSGHKYIKAKWYKRTAQVTGYQVRYSTSKSFKTYKTKTIKKNSILSKKILKLKADKRYYVKVRTYKTVNGTKYYSAWSKVKSIKTA